MRAALALLLLLAAACRSAGGPRFPESIARCSPQSGGTARLVISTRLSWCDLQGSPLQPRLDVLSAEEDWLTGIGTEADVVLLRAHRCPTAVLCTDSNAWAALIEAASPEELRGLVRDARSKAQPPGQDKR